MLTRCMIPNSHKCMAEQNPPSCLIQPDMQSLPFLCFYSFYVFLALTPTAPLGRQPVPSLEQRTPSPVSRKGHPGLVVNNLALLVWTFKVYGEREEIVVFWRAERTEAGGC